MTEMSFPLKPEDKPARIPSPGRHSSSGGDGMGRLPPAPQPRTPDAGLDIFRLRELIGFPLRCVQRHKRLTSFVFVGTLLAAVLVAAFMPRSYHVETKLLAQRSAVMLALGNPRRNIPTDADAPTRLASETVRNRDNMLQLINQTNLLKNWERIRSPAGRIKEQILTSVLNRAPLTDAERTEQLVDLLIESFYVDAGSDGADGTVTISIEWLDAASAVQLVEQARQNFLEHRRAEEIARIAESIAILERHVDSAQTVIAQAMNGAAAAAQPVMLGDARRARNAATSTPMSEEREEVSVALETKQAVIGDLESARTRRIGELQGQLSTLRNRYGPAHPDLQSIQEQLTILSADSPQLAALRAEEAALQQRLRALGGAPRLAAIRPEYAPSPGLPSSGLTAGRMYAESKLRMAIADYEDMTDRLKGANIELETARAAFKYRYVVQSRALYPKKPSKPNLKLLAIGGLIGAFVLALFAAIGTDLARGRLLEPWQVELIVGIPVLGHIRRQ